MQLRYIENGSFLQLRPEEYTLEHGRVFDVTFYGMQTFTSFWVKSEELYKSFPTLKKNMRLGITFQTEETSYRFTGEAIDANMEGSYYLTLIEQITPIEIVSRRTHFREEMILPTNVYGLAPESLHSALPRKAADAAEFTCEVFDISDGGICLVSNELFNSPYEPYFLVEFTLRGKDYFLLPAKLVRKGQCPQTTMFKYDYGFNFIFDHKPEEKHRLSDAIFSAKLDRL